MQEKVAIYFSCNICNQYIVNKFNYDKHLLTAKHIKSIIVNKNVGESSKSSKSSINPHTCQKKLRLTSTLNKLVCIIPIIYIPKVLKENLKLVCRHFLRIFQFVTIFFLFFILFCIKIKIIRQNLILTICINLKQSKSAKNLL